jgi:hypothetical protein
MTNTEEFLQQWRERPAIGERYRPSADPTTVCYVDYNSKPSGAPKVIVFIDDFGLGPWAFADIGRLFDDADVGLWLTSIVADRLGERMRRRIIRDLLTGCYPGPRVDLALLAESNAPGLWHQAWRQASRG